MRMGQSVCVFWPPVKNELLLSMRYQSLVRTSMMSPPTPDPLFNELLRWLVTSTIFVRYYCLIARKLAEFFRYNCGFRPFYAAFCFDEVSRGSILCLLNANIAGTAISQRHNSAFCSKMDVHGVPRGDTGRILAKWRHPVASKVALDLPFLARPPFKRSCFKRMWLVLKGVWSSKSGVNFCKRDAKEAPSKPVIVMRAWSTFDASR